jgi:hypothetical protein
VTLVGVAVLLCGHHAEATKATASVTVTVIDPRAIGTIGSPVSAADGGVTVHQIEFE